VEKFLNVAKESFKLNKKIGFLSKVVVKSKSEGG